MRTIFDLSIEAVNPNNRGDDYENQFFAMQSFDSEEQALVAFGIMENFVVSQPHILTIELASCMLSDNDVYIYTTKKILKSISFKTDDNGDVETIPAENFFDWDKSVTE
jgi:hypothetical protein